MATVFTVAQMATAGLLPKEHGSRQLFTRSVVLDFDQIATQTGVSLATGDTFPVLTVFGGETIIEAGVDILKVATAAADIDLGFTGGDVDGLVDGVEADDVDFTVKAARGVLLPLYIGTTDTVDVLEVGGQALAGCIARVWLLVSRW